MGYEVRFYPPEEKMKEYKPWNGQTVDSYERMIKNSIRTLISYCLKDQSEKFTGKIADEINYELRMLYSEVEQSCKFDAYERWSHVDEDEGKHFVWYCGWGYARDCNFEKHEIIENTTDRLVILADVVRTPDYFDGNGRFSQKHTEIIEEVEGFVEIVRDIVNHQIMDDLAEWKEKDDEELTPEKIEGTNDYKYLVNGELLDSIGHDEVVLHTDEIDMTHAMNEDVIDFYEKHKDEMTVKAEGKKDEDED